MNKLVVLTCLALSFAPTAARAQTPTMDSLWPNDDGRAWTYDVHNVTTDTGTAYDDAMRLVLDGTVVAPGGIAAQYLREQDFLSTSATKRSDVPVADPLLRNLWIARPALRSAIQRLDAESPCPTGSTFRVGGLLLCGEFAYRKTADEVAAWRCNATALRAWQWLPADVSVGSTFTLPLIPDLVNDAYLHGTVSAIETATVPAGTFPNCVRVDYVADYGQSVCTDGNGDVVGSWRYETRGFVRYAPAVGPVEAYEEFRVVESAGSCAPAPVGLVQWLTTKLNSTPVPVARGTWGRLKAMYR